MSERQTHFYAVEALPEVYRSVFRYDQFNEVQSKCLPTLWHTNDSLVVAAPTGSGKTVLLELAICRAFHEYSGETLAVYIAPTKCLVQQKVAEWREKFSTLGLKVAELTGDLDEVRNTPDRDILAHVICTTPEKWDLEVRPGGAGGPAWLNGRKVNVYLIDEVHAVGEPDRGPILEAVLTRTIARCSSQLTPLPRFVAISATIANPDDIGRWLGRSAPWHGYSFGEQTRTVPIEASVRGYYCPPDRSTFHFDANLNYKLPMLLREVLPSNKSAIIFVSSRAATVSCAKCLANDRPWARSTYSDELRRLAKSFKDKRLRDFIERGVGYHNAGLTSDDRSLLEKAFNCGLVRILVCTSTLAMGVNLPAYLVVVRGTTMTTGGICEQYSAARIHQMVGRAGRPGLEDTGRAVIMTTSNQVARYEDIVQGVQDTVESYLQRDIMRHVNREIVHKSIRSMADVVAWLKSTFFFVRLAQNPKRYLPVGHSLAGLDDYIVGQCQQALDSLSKMGFVEKTNKGIKATELGQIFSRFHMSFSGFESFVQELRSAPDAGLSKERLLSIIVQSPDFCGSQIRSSEKALLRQLNKHVRYKLSTKPSQWKYKEKIFLLLQSNLDRIDITDASPRIERSSMLKLACRVCRCLLEALLCLHRQKQLSESLKVLAAISNFRTTRNIALLAKAFECGLWHDSVHCLQQLADVGVKRGSVLRFHGLTSFRALRDAEPNLIEMATHTQPPFGSKLKRRAEHNFPRYSLEVVGYSEHLKVTMSLANQQVDAVRAAAILIVGNEDTGIVFLRKVSHQELIAIGGLSVHVEVPPKWDQLNVLLINETLAGVDITVSVTHLGTDAGYPPTSSDQPESLLETSIASGTPSPRPPSIPPNHLGAQPDAIAVDPEKTKAADGWEVSQVNRWAVEMLFAQPRHQTPTPYDSIDTVEDELIAVIEKAMALLDLNFENADDKAASKTNSGRVNTNLADGSAGEFVVDSNAMSRILTSVVNNEKRCDPLEEEELTTRHNIITEAAIPSDRPRARSSSEDSFNQLLDAVDIPGNLKDTSEVQRSQTPDDLFDSISSPEMFNAHAAPRSDDLLRIPHNATLNRVYTPVKRRKKKGTSTERETTAPEASTLSASDRSATHKRRAPAKRSAMNARGAVRPMSVRRRNSPPMSPVDLIHCETMLESDPTQAVGSRPTVSSKPPRRSGASRSGQAPVAEARPLAKTSNISLDAPVASPPYPFATRTSESISEPAPRNTALQNMMNLIRDTEEFCNS